VFVNKSSCLSLERVQTRTNRRRNKNVNIWDFVLASLTTIGIRAAKTLEWRHAGGGGDGTNGKFNIWGSERCIYAITSSVSSSAVLVVVVIRMPMENLYPFALNLISLLLFTEIFPPIVSRFDWIVPRKKAEEGNFVCVREHFVCRKTQVIRLIDFNKRIKHQPPSTIHVCCRFSSFFSRRGTISPSIDINKLSCKYVKGTIRLNLMPSNKYLHSL
jgi:hypothetical protein